jgi:hypothetical protein
MDSIIAIWVGLCSICKITATGTQMQDFFHFCDGSHLQIFIKSGIQKGIKKALRYHNEGALGKNSMNKS